MMRNYFIILSLCFFTFCCGIARAQNKNNYTLSLQFLQLKEGFNYGLVFSGPQIGFQYQRNWDLKKSVICYQPRLALGAPFSKGMVAVTIHFVPVDVSWLASVIERNCHTLKLGVNVKTNYTCQSYPYLQSGHLFWFTEIGLSPCLHYAYQWKNRRITLCVTNSLAGFVSRPETNDPYFFSTNFSDLFINIHQNLQFGSFNKYNHTDIFIEYTPHTAKHHSFAFGADYLGAFYGTGFQSLSYYLQWKLSF